MSTPHQTLTDEAIDAAKARLSLPHAHHQHNDCIRIAYEWLDAQVKLARRSASAQALKHHIEAWGKRYVSQSDVEVAAELHPDVVGDYPGFNLSKKLTLPKKQRLSRIEEAGKHPNYARRFNAGTYRHQEEV